MTRRAAPPVPRPVPAPRRPPGEPALDGLRLLLDERVLASRWLIARTRVGERYPCRCNAPGGRACSPRYCPCAGRADVDDAPGHCCAHRYGPAEAAAAQRTAR